MRKPRIHWPWTILFLCGVLFAACTDKKTTNSSPISPSSAPGGPVKIEKGSTENVGEEAPAEDDWLAKLEAQAASTSASEMGNAQGLLADNAAVNRAVGNAVDRLNVPLQPAQYRDSPQHALAEGPPPATPYSALSLFDYCEDLCALNHYQALPKSSFGQKPEAVVAEQLDHEALAYPCVRSHYAAPYTNVENPHYLPVINDDIPELACDTGVVSNRGLYEMLIATHADFRVVLDEVLGNQVQQLTYPSSGQSQWVRSLEDRLLSEMEDMSQEISTADKAFRTQYVAALDAAFAANDAAAVEGALAQLVELQTTQLASDRSQNDLLQGCQHKLQLRPELFTPQARELVGQLDRHYEVYDRSNRSGLSRNVISKLSARLDTWPLPTDYHDELVRIQQTYQQQLAEVRQYKQAHLSAVRLQAPVLSVVERAWLETYFGELGALEQTLQTTTAQLELTMKSSASDMTLADFAAVIELERKNSYDPTLKSPFDASRAGLVAIRTHYHKLVQERAAAFEAALAQQ